MVNFVTKEHLSRYPGCEGNLSFDPSSSLQWGLGWREAAHCPKCHYISKRFKLYMEVNTGKRGVKAATANTGMAVAMTQTPVGPTSVRKLCLGSNIPAPSVSGMQQNANKVNNIITEENRKDMRRIRAELKLVNKYRNEPINQIPIQADGQYNNNLYSGVGKTPFQPATQASYTVAENVTFKKQIIAAEAINKLCSKHGFHAKHDEPCDIQSDQCSATTCMETTIGDEKTWATHCLQDLHDDSLEINFLTTDADTGAFQAAEDLYSKNITTTKPHHLFDTRHLADNHRKQMNNCSRILNMMPGHDAAYRKFLRGRFALDLSKRCTAEFNAFYEKESGNFSKISENIKMSIHAIKRCYCNDHSGCKLNSLVCRGGKTDNWLSNSSFLTRNFKINLTASENEYTLLDWIEFRLGEDMLQKTRLNTNTQKIEGTNRAIRKCIPKNVTYSRNYEGRLNSAIHSVNNGPGISIRKLCMAADCPLPETGNVATQLWAEQRRSELKKEREKSATFKLKKKLRRTIMYKLHEQHREQHKYVKAQLLKDRQLKIRQKRRQQMQHQTAVTGGNCSSTTDHQLYARHFYNRGGKRQAGRCQQAKIPCLAKQ